MDMHKDLMARWLAYGKAMQKSGSNLPRHLIADTEQAIAAAEQVQQITDSTRVAWTSLGTVKAMLPELLASDDVKVRENAQIIDALVKLVGCQQQAGHIGDANKMVQAAPAGWRGVIPGRRRTDNWDSARVADFNNGWNAYQHAVKSALAELEGRPE